ncbi:MAG: hypothetical protein AAF211_09090 [Myxococcota bacterium]
MRSVLGASTTQASFSDRAEVSRMLSRDDSPTERMHVEVRRPAWEASPQDEAETVGFLKAQARQGLELIVGTGGPGRAARKLRLDPRFTVADRAALEGLGWVAAGKPSKAKASFRSASRRIGLEVLVDRVGRWAHPSDLRPWMLLDRLTRRQDRSGVTVLEGLARIGALDEAARLVERMDRSSDPVARARSGLVRMRMMGDPLAALAVVDEAGRSAGPQLQDRERWRIALGWVEFGGVESAGAWLASLRDPQWPGARATRLALDAARGASRQDVVAQAGKMLAESPSDPDVIYAVAVALQQVGETAAAVDVVRTLARAMPRVPALWGAVADRALGAGDVPLALDAALRAAALDPEDEALGVRVLDLASALGDPERVVATYDRLGRAVPIATPTVEERLETFPDARLAVLQSADLRDAPTLLAERARLRIEAGNLGEAARDGLVLSRRLGRAEGTALAFAAMAGRQRSTALERALWEAARTDRSAWVAAIEHTIVSRGDTSWLAAARESDAPRAVRMAEVIERPLAAARGLEGWPDPAPVAQGPSPVDVRASGALGAHPGVQAWTDVRTGVSLLQVPGATPSLPPPLGVLYRAASRAERSASSLQVVRLTGSVLPLYVARSEVPGFTRYGLASTAEAAEQALLRAWPTSAVEAGPISPQDDNR